MLGFGAFGQTRVHVQTRRLLGSESEGVGIRHVACKHTCTSCSNTRCCRAGGPSLERLPRMSVSKHSAAKVICAERQPRPWIVTRRATVSCGSSEGGGGHCTTSCAW